MGLCVVLNPDGTLSPTGQPVSDCTVYVLTTPADVLVADTIASAFVVPAGEVLAAWFAGVFSLVVVCYLAARAIGSVVNSVR